MKFTNVVSILATVASVTALSDCILSCQESVSAASGCGSDYNTTLCYCSTTYATNVKACLYQNACNTDVATFYSNVNDYCGGDEVTTKPNATVASTDGLLGSCVLDCQASVASDAGCSSNYNESSCYCDNTDFATNVKVCLYQNCSSYVSVFYNFRADVCNTTDSAEWYSSIISSDPTVTPSGAIASATGASDASTTTSTTATSATAGVNKSDGLSAGAKAGISVGSIIGGLIVMVAIAFAVWRSKRTAAIKRDAESVLPVKEVADTSSMVSGETAVRK